MKSSLPETDRHVESDKHWDARLIGELMRDSPESSSGQAI